MQTAPKTPRIKFAVRVLAVTLCLAIGLSGVVIPVQGLEDPVSPIFIQIASDLAAQGIASNIGNVTMLNYTSFPGLYFEKRTIVTDPATAIGKIVFSSPLNFSDIETQTFLQNLGTNMEMSEGHIEFDARTSAEFAAHGATLVIYNNPPGLFPPGLTMDNLIVRDDSGNILPTSDVVSEFSQDPITGDITFNAAHFTQFDIFPYRIYLPLVIR